MVFNDTTITSLNDSLLSWFNNSKLKDLLCVISNVSLDINCIGHDLSYTFVQCLKLKNDTQELMRPIIDCHGLTSNAEHGNPEN